MEKTCAKADTPKKKIRAIFDFYIKDILADKNQNGCLPINVSLELGAADKEVAEMFHSSHGDAEQLFASLIKEGQASGEISKKHTAKALSRLFLTA